MNERTAEFLSEYAKYLETALLPLGFTIHRIDTTGAVVAQEYRVQLTTGTGSEAKVYQSLFVVTARDAFNWGASDAPGNVKRARRYARYQVAVILDQVVGALTGEKEMG